MTPKEKANDLCMMFLIKTTTDIPYGVNKTIAKECALIAVEEILKLDNPNTYNYLTENKEHLIVQLAVKYWQEVKKEIEAL